MTILNMNNQSADADHVTICEMAPRDGLQFLGANTGVAPQLITIDQKTALVAALCKAGLRFIEVGAFVSPKVTPQMADTDELVRQLAPSNGVRFAALVPNRKHYERFRASSLDTVALFVSASEAYSQKNMGVSLAQAMDWAAEAADAARADGKTLRAHVSGAFQDVYSSTESDVGEVAGVVRRLIEMGCDHVALADTNGDTHPRRVRDVIRTVATEAPITAIGVHLHDRNGAGLANAVAALESGVRIFDASVGGLGGSATASKSGDGVRQMAGNLATEELVALFERMGFSTGIDAAALVDAGRIAYEITRFTGDFAPPSRLLREQLGFGLVWAKSPG